MKNMNQYKYRIMKINTQGCSVATVSNWQKEQRHHEAAIPTNSCCSPGHSIAAAIRISAQNAILGREDPAERNCQAEPPSTPHPDFRVPATPSHGLDTQEHQCCISCFSFLFKKKPNVQAPGWLCNANWGAQTQPIPQFVYRGTFLTQTNTWM